MRWSHPDLGVKLQKSLHSYIKVWNRVLQQSEIESEMISILFGITPEIISFQFLKRPLLNRRAKIWELTKRKIEGDTKWLQSLPRDYNHDHNRVSVRLIRGQPWPLWAPPGLRQEAGAKVRPHHPNCTKDQAEAAVESAFTRRRRRWNPPLPGATRTPCPLTGCHGDCTWPLLCSTQAACPLLITTNREDLFYLALPSGVPPPQAPQFHV